MDNVIEFKPLPTKQKVRGWVCECGGFEWLLLDTGDAVCTRCEHISAKVKALEIPTQEEVDLLMRSYDRRYQIPRWVYNVVTIITAFAIGVLVTLTFKAIW